MLFGKFLLLIFVGIYILIYLVIDIMLMINKFNYLNILNKLI